MLTLEGTVEAQSNGYTDTVIGTLAVDGWAVTCWYSEKGPLPAGAPPSPLFAVPNVTAQPSAASGPVYQLHVIRCGTVIASAP